VVSFLHGFVYVPRIFHARYMIIWSP
jgi:hypothetical protein